MDNEKKQVTYNSSFSGAHLHFEMYINGSRIDPQTRYPGVSFTYSANA